MRHNRQRGSAMTELMICLFPYAMIVLGVILIGHLALGRQEVNKAVAWAATKPLEQSRSDVSRHFYKGVGVTEEEFEFRDEAFATEGELEAYLPVDDARDEPILPYSGTDVEAAVTRSAIRVRASVSIGTSGRPEVNVGINVTREGREMAQAGLVDVQGVDQNIGIGAGEMGDININFPVDQAMSQDIADALGSWMTYSRAEGGYEYSLEAGGEGFREEMVIEQETGSTDRQELRKTWRLEPPEDNPDTAEDESDPDALAFYAASKNEEGARGAHHNDSVDMEAFTDLTPVDGNLLSPDNPPRPSMDQNDADKDFWDRTFLERQP